MTKLKIGEHTRKFFTGEIIKANEEDRTITGVASHQSPDRDGDVIIQEGWDLKNFKKNAVMPWGHNYQGLPVAKITKAWVEGKKLLFKATFAGEEQSHPFAETVFRLFKDGFLKAFSVGFIPKELEPNEKTGGYMIKEAELLEISAVLVPCHPSAIVSTAKSFAKNDKDEDELVEFLKGAMLSEEPTAEKKEKNNEEKIKIIASVLAEKHEELKTMRKYFAIFSEATGVQRTADELNTIEEIGTKIISMLKTIEVLQSKTKKEIKKPEANRPAAAKTRTVDDVEDDFLSLLSR